ncbi:MAG: creatininase family protein [Planctomycetaceae bacterium]|nr:creatininase family protein [Planctomycetaceae bacterium]
MSPSTSSPSSTTSISSEKVRPELKSWLDRGPRPGWLGLWLLLLGMALLVSIVNYRPPTEERQSPAMAYHTVTLPPLSEPLPSLWIEDLTWTEIAQAQTAGYDTVLLASGGIEPNGPHLPIGKHNAIVRAAANEIARRRGKTLIAPLLVYVPEQPFANYPGTISLSPELFQQVIEATTQGFLSQGFQHVILLGDSGGNQEPLRAAANSLRLNCRTGQRVVFLDQYYFGHGQGEWLRGQGLSLPTLGTHAGVADTAEWMAAQASDLRNVELISRTDLVHDGDPTLATRELGQQLLELKIQAALRQLESEIPNNRVAREFRSRP